VLFACAVAAIFVLGAAMLLIGKEAAAPQVPAGGSSDTRTPQSPYYIVGYTNNSVGVPLIGCDVTITNVRLGVSVSVVSSSLGKFMYNLASMGEENQYADGDLITVEAELGELSGEAEGYVDTSGQLTMINVTLTTARPEFSMVIVPVVGMMALFVVVGLRKRNERT
jgi:hypothetical protein